MKVAIIPADNTKPIIVQNIDPGLGSLQHLVGGDVELVGLRSLDMNMYLNEEGKLMSLPRNHRATVLCQQSQAIRIDDYICGDAVIVGPFDGEGGDTDLSDVQQRLLYRFDAQLLDLHEGK
ncbi:hypothetical protein GCM10023063_19220 [Arthrobacter methylotrophus]|uniref:DUF3846 domain-containing protein n=1 Tax=Arthrobacter methylotrophus TaxID=121291 RepID=A0ABV5UP73_9MICC